MKSISLTCGVCNSRIELTDAAESTINPSGSLDKSGRRYLIEARAEEWLNRHQPCVDNKNKLMMALPKKETSK